MGQLTGRCGAACCAYRVLRAPDPDAERLRTSIRSRAAGLSIAMASCSATRSHAVACCMRMLAVISTVSEHKGFRCDRPFNIR